MTPKAIDSALDTMAAMLEFFPRAEGERAAIVEQLQRMIPPVAIAVTLSKPQPDCPHCRGGGYAIVEREGITGARRCECVKATERKVTDDAQVLWLARRMVQLFKTWPGGHELRAVYCWRFKPADGFAVFSQAYPDGVLPEEYPDRIQLPAAVIPKRLEPGEGLEGRGDENRRRHAQ